MGLDASTMGCAVSPVISADMGWANGDTFHSKLIRSPGVPVLGNGGFCVIVPGGNAFGSEPGVDGLTHFNG